MHHLQLPRSNTIRPSHFPTPTNSVYAVHVRTFSGAATSSGSLPDLHIQRVSRGNDEIARFTDPQTQNDKTKLCDAKIKDQLENGDCSSSLSLNYHLMLDEKISPNATTFCSMLEACSLSNDLNTLRLLHNDILRLQLHSHVSVVFALMLAYAECGRNDLAHQVLDSMAPRDVVSWTFLIRHGIQNRRFDLAIWIFEKMILAGILPDAVTLVCVLLAISRSGLLKQGKEVHGYVIRRGLGANRILLGSLVSMYAKLGKLALADRTSQGGRGNVVVLTTMIGGFLNAGDPKGAIRIFLELMNSGNQPTEKTISCTLRAVSVLGSSRIGSQMHCQVIKRSFIADKFVMSSLMDMYAKSGVGSCVCRKLFDEMPQKDVVCWTALISAHGRMGEGSAALQAFDDMIEAGVFPDSITFTSVLQACSSSGMLGEGLRYFDSMIRHHKIKPREAHYACLMDLIAKGGRLGEAYEIVQSLDMKNDGRVWEVLLCACKVHGNVGLGELAARRILENEPGNQTRCYQLLSDIYAAVGRSDKARNLSALTESTGVI